MRTRSRVGGARRRRWLGQRIGQCPPGRVPRLAAGQQDRHGLRAQHPRWPPSERRWSCPSSRGRRRAACLRHRRPRPVPGVVVGDPRSRWPPGRPPPTGEWLRPPRPRWPVGLQQYAPPGGPPRCPAPSGPRPPRSPRPRPTRVLRQPGQPGRPRLPASPGLPEWILLPQRRHRWPRWSKRPARKQRQTAVGGGWWWAYT